MKKKISRQGKQMIAAFCAVVLSITGIPAINSSNIEAAKAMKLSNQKLTLMVQQTKKLKIKNKKGSVKWKSSKKEVAAVSQKGVVKAKKKGKTTISATVVYKKKKTVLKCAVTVKAANKTSNDQKKDEINANGQNVMGKSPIISIPKSTISGNVNQKTSAPASTTPGNTNPGTVPPAKPTPMSPDQNPSKSSSEPTAPQDISDGVVDENGGYTITGVYFENQNITYRMNGTNKICVDITGRDSLRDAVPDVTKCRFDCVYRGTSYTDLEVYQPVWKDEPYFSSNVDAGYYEFKLRVVDAQGDVHYLPQFMLEDCYGYISSGSYGDFRLESIACDGNRYQLEQGSHGNQFMLDIPDGAKIRDYIPGLKNAEISAYWRDKQVTVTEITDIHWYTDTYYYYYHDSPGTHTTEKQGYCTFTLKGMNGAQKIEEQIAITGYNNKLEINKIKSNSMSSFEISNSSASVYFYCAVPEGKALNEYIPNPAEDLSFECSYLGKNYTATEVDRVQWHESSENPYYTMRVICEIDGQKRFRYIRLDSYEIKNTVLVSGLIRNENLEPLTDYSIVFKSLDGQNKYGYTNEEGKYRVYLQPGKYEVWCQDQKCAMILVGDSSVTYDIPVKGVYSLSGILKRKSKAWSNQYVHIMRKNAETGEWEYWGGLKTEEGGTYKEYVTDGTYRCFIDDVIIAELKISGSSQIYDLECDFNCMWGKILTKNNKPLREERLTFASDAGAHIRCTTDKYGRYSVYAAPNMTYQILDRNGVKLETVASGTEDSENKIYSDKMKLSGTLRAKDGEPVANREIKFYDENGKQAGNYMQTDEAGRYDICLKEGVYKVKDAAGGVICQQFVVDTTAQKDIEGALYKVSGIVQSEGVLQVYSDISIKRYKKNGSYYRFLCNLQTEKDGTYAVYLPDGIYKFEDIKVKVKGAEVKQDIEFQAMSEYMVHGGIMLRENVPFDSNRSFDVYDSTGNYVSSIYVGNTFNYYTIELKKPGTYTVQLNDEVLDTFTVSERITEKDIILDRYLVTGYLTCEDLYAYHNCYMENEAGQRIKGALSYYYTSDGTNAKYEYLLEPGTYQLKAGRGMSYDMDEDAVIKTITVMDQDIMGKKAEAVAIPLYAEVNCTLKDTRGNPITSAQQSILFCNENEEYSYGSMNQNNGVISCRLKPGTYAVEFNNHRVGMIEMGEMDTTVTLQTSEVYITGTFKTPENARFSTGSMYFEGKEKSTRLYLYVRKDGEVFHAYLPPDEYVVQYYFGGKLYTDHLTVAENTETYDTDLKLADNADGTGE